MSALRYGQAKVRGQKGRPRLTAVDPQNITEVFRFEWKDGSDSTIRALTDDQTVIDEAYGKTENLDIGDTINVLSPAGKRHTFKVTGR